MIHGLSKLISIGINDLSIYIWLKKAINRLLGRLKRRSDFPVYFVGYNWKIHNKMPVAILFGFNPWKRQVTSAYLSQYKTAFALGNASFLRIKNQFIKHLPDNQEIVLISWGNKASWNVRLFRLYVIIQRLFHKKIIKQYAIEDGFLRSMGSGLPHTRPASLCIDGKGIYFNAHRPSELEQLLNEHDFTSSPGVIFRAKQGIELMQLARLTKYYDLQPYPGESSFKS